VRQLSNKFKIALVLSLVVAFSSCIHKEFEEPPVNVIPEGNIYTISDLYSIYYSDSVKGLYGYDATYKFTEECSVYGVISMDDKSGNLYKSAYMQDGIKGINLHLMSSGGLYEGDSVRIYLKGLVLGNYSGMIQLDSVLVDDNIVKIATQKDVVPELTTIDQIITLDEDHIFGWPYLGRIVKIENVQFTGDDLNKTYANADDYITENRTLVDENNKSIIVRTSGYASFAGTPVDDGRGDIIALASYYNGAWQLLLRSTSEIDFDKRRFGDYDTVFFAGFDEIEVGTPIDYAGWGNIAETGTLSWIGKNNGIAGQARIVGDGNANETWLILPEVTISTEKLSFETRVAYYSGATLTAYISMDYNGGGDPNTGTWTELPADIATGPITGFGEKQLSGTIDLSAYIGTAYIAFKYESTAGQSGEYLLDDVLIFNE